MITVDEALKRGKHTVNIPVFIVMFGVMGLSFGLAYLSLVPYYWIGVGIILGPLAGWVYWSFAITRWRIWAFTNVDDVHELKSSAVYERLIWPDGSVFEKTEIRSKRDKELLKELQRRFDEPRPGIVIVDDPTIPQVTNVFYSKTKLMMHAVIMAACSSMGIYLLATDRSLLLGSVFAVFGAFGVIKRATKIADGSPQLVLDTVGIRIKDKQYAWSETSDITVKRSANTWLNFNTDDGPVNIIIEDLDISVTELLKRINVYQLRFKDAS